MTQRNLEQHIAGALAGMVLGDAFGVPGELWPRQKVRQRFGDITTFLDGPQDNIVACYFKAGHYTDDSAQALVILHDLLKYGRVPEVKILAQDLIAWVESMNGFEINLLGPSSKAALLAHVKGEDYTVYTKTALTNGAAMRIAPVGCFFNQGEEESLSRTVAKVSAVTHGTDVAIAGASMVAAAVAAFLHSDDRQAAIHAVKQAYHAAMPLGEPTWAADLLARFELSLKKIEEHPSEEQMSLWVYQVLGTGTMTSESVSAALAIAFYCDTPQQAAHLCANLGGDTDTIGAMACAIVGARCGLSGFAKETIAYLEKTNQLDFKALAATIVAARDSFIKE
ncbi:MAG: ADP-ribosylglycohydrolase family protein [Candidatus Anaerobiospirillum merdipullorum]|uniref:ADP-ribosylglycohydrolase family protein n=1 Tax=Candidatus Anaerobiospirillum merdipullorum TaxID=2838450 RepID=A0A9E2KM57_9GAMM|nr:ADP-ribosylglycohydrolase family protein [Candidatus Anaerobiospirillum merdipullorum]